MIFFRNLGCGKLVCTYPSHIPFTKIKGAIIYAQVQEQLCVSFDFMRGPTVQDPLMVKDGTKCGPRKVRNVLRAWKWHTIITTATVLELQLVATLQYNVEVVCTYIFGNWFTDHCLNLGIFFRVMVSMTKSDGKVSSRIFFLLDFQVCLNGTCHPHSVLKYDCNVNTKCSGHGVSNGAVRVVLSCRLILLKREDLLMCLQWLAWDLAKPMFWANTRSPKLLCSNCGRN